MDVSVKNPAVILFPLTCILCGLAKKVFPLIPISTPLINRKIVLCCWFVGVEMVVM